MRETLLELIEHDTRLRRVANNRNRGSVEYSGSCPFCGGTDRFRVWPDYRPAPDAPDYRQGRWECMRGHCGRRGDAIDYVQYRDGVNFYQAYRIVVGTAPTGDYHPPVTRPPIIPCLDLDPPNEIWQARAKVFCQVAQDILWSTQDGQFALAFLHWRGLKDETIRYAGLGWQPTWQKTEPREWGIDDDEPVRLVPGLIIPGVVAGVYWGVQTRTKDNKLYRYLSLAGSSLPLYQADLLAPDKPAMLLESPLDALLVLQEAGDLVSPVATFGTGGAKHLYWQAHLAIPPDVLVSTDADDGGDKAALFWLTQLPHARQWRPLLKDPTEMHQLGIELRKSSPEADSLGLSVREWVEESVSVPRSDVIAPKIILPAAASTTTPLRVVSRNPSAPRVRLEGTSPQLKVVRARWQQLLQHLPEEWWKEELAIAAAQAYSKAGEPTIAVALYRWEQVPSHLRGSKLWELMGAAIRYDEESRRKVLKILEGLALNGGSGMKDRVSHA